MTIHTHEFGVLGVFRDTRFVGQNIFGQFCGHFQIVTFQT